MGLGACGANRDDDAAATPSDEAAAWLRGLLHDRAFMAFVQEEPYRYRAAEEYRDLPLPAGVDAGLARELVAFARRMRAMPLVADEEEGGPHPYWVISPDMYGTVCDLSARAGVSSDLQAALCRLGSRPELQRLIERDVDAALKRDGVEVGFDALRALVAGSREPQGPCERLVANALAMMADEDVVPHPAPPQPAGEVGTPVEPSWLAGLYSRLVEGAAGLTDHPRRRIPAFEIIGVPESGPQTLEGLWTRIERAGRFEVHPLMDVVFVSDIMFDNGPFERFNGLMELVLRHALTRGIGLPALRFVPYSALRLDWETGVGPQDHAVPYGQAAIVESYGVDSTLSLRESIGCLERGLRDLERVVRGIEERDAAQIAAIEKDWRLNPRQRDLLRGMVANPGQVIDALGYERTFGIAQSTAHTDLGALVRMGLLVVETEGKKRVYHLREAGLGC